MKNRFEHEINITKHFLKELEEYLQDDNIVKREEAESKRIEMELDLSAKIFELGRELSKARLKVSQMAMEKGKLLKKIEQIQDVESLSIDCGHWWKAMGVVTSAYFIDVDRSYMRYEISECKMCAKNKTILLDPQISEPDATGRP